MASLLPVASCYMPNQGLNRELAHEKETQFLIFGSPLDRFEQSGNYPHLHSLRIVGSINNDNTSDRPVPLALCFPLHLHNISDRL